MENLDKIVLSKNKKYTKTDMGYYLTLDNKKDSDFTRSKSP